MPISKKTGKRYAAGSQKSYGGWEDRHCYHCGRTLTLKDAAMSSLLANGATFTLCNDHISHYSEAYADFAPANVDHADRIHPDQLELTDALITPAAVMGRHPNRGVPEDGWEHDT